MNVRDHHIELIRNDLRSRGIRMQQLEDDLVDHICCALEESGHGTFEAAYHRILSSFGENGLLKIQYQIISNSKNEVAMKKIMYSLGFVATFLITTGLLFKVQHWPGAAIMLTLGIALLNFGFLPMFFYDRYKRSIS